MCAQQEEIDYILYSPFWVWNVSILQIDACSVHDSTKI